MTDQEAITSLTAMKSETETLKSAIIAGYTDFDNSINELETSYSTVASQVSSQAPAQVASLQAALDAPDGE